MNCSCGNTFTPTPEAFQGAQLFADRTTGDVWLYTLLFACGRCKSTRCQIMYCNEPEETELAAE